METLTQYRQIIQKVLLPYTKIPYSHGQLSCNPIFDEVNDSYALITLGWDRKTRVHGCLIHQQFQIQTVSMVIQNLQKQSWMDSMF